MKIQLLLLLLLPFVLPAQKALKPRLFVLSVGVSTYQSNHIQNLRFANNDARDFAAALQKQTKLWRVEQVKTLTDADATRQNVRTALDNLVPLINSDDFFIFFFSGHGGQDRLLPNDAKADDVDATTLGKDDLFKKINKIGCGYIVFLDACHSGSFAKSSFEFGSSGKAETEEIININGLVEALSARDKPNLVFGSSASDQKSFECEPCENGYFAQTILDVFENKSVNEGSKTYTPDADGDGNVSTHELDIYVKNAVRIRTKPLGSPQKMFSSLKLGDDFPIFRVGSSTAPHEILNTDDDPDGDGIPTARDGCPTEFGTTKANGCPDFDDDGVPDKSDACPQKSGKPNWQGCPDSDGDGLHDGKDNCPNEKGTMDNNGCILEPQMILVDGGTFKMGSRADGIHTVTLSNFYLGKFEVTNIEFVQFLNDITSQLLVSEDGSEVKYQGNLIFENKFDWKKIIKCSSSPPRKFTVAAEFENKPINYVSWYGAKDYSEWLSLKTDKNYRLPTEAEWEFAARGGNKSKGYSSSGSNDIEEVGWISENTPDPEPQSVGHKKPNELGFYDMSGNVLEWCLDFVHGYDIRSQTNPRNLMPSGQNILRGSCIGSPKSDLITQRSGMASNSCSSIIGFRLAKSP